MRTTKTDQETIGSGGSVSGGVPARIPDPPDLGPPPGWKRAWQWWLGKSTIIAAKQNRIFSWLAFYCGLSTVGFWIRRQDRLDRVVRPVGESGWHQRDEPIPTDPRRVKRPF
ncbi:MAG: hypothetical protein VX498_03735 [Myxococcota bacterium]|nr:hypothetical protein [Myxococcota bacterium]